MADELLTPAEVATMFRVNPKTVTRWARAGKISAVRTLGGHRRFRAEEIRRFLEEIADAESENPSPAAALILRNARLAGSPRRGPGVKTRSGPAVRRSSHGCAAPT